jgi:broad specificity phosphatase PhoE
VREDQSSSTKPEPSEGGWQCQDSHRADGTLATEKPLESQPIPTRITFISHATTAAVRHASFPSNEPLIEGEIEKIASIKWVAPRAQTVLCGPEQRTQQTAKALGFEPSISSDLADVNYGVWEGKRIDDIQTGDPAGLADWLTNVHASPHGGESISQAIQRVQQWMDRQPGTGHIIAMTHPAVIRAAILCAMHAPPESFWRIEIATLSITDLRFNGKFWTVRSAGSSLRFDNTVDTRG